MSSSPAIAREMSPGSPAATDPLIAVRGLAKTYGTGPGAVRALEAIDFEVREGEFVAILGPSGCGKTTLLKILAGLIPRARGARYSGARRSRGRGGTSAWCSRRRCCFPGAR